MTHLFKVIIPVRLTATRLPKKPLLSIGDKPLIQHVYESAKKSSADSVIIATDSPEIRNVAESFGATVHMTAETHESGTERLIEVIEQRDEADDTIIVNLQGDEFNMPPAFIDKVAGTLNTHEDIGMATLCEPITDLEAFNDPHFVKVTFNKDRIALDFRREPPVWPVDSPALPKGVYGYGHIGMYAYRTWFIRQYARLPHCEREKNEHLEQLRVLEHGFKIYVEVVPENPGIGIDTSRDLELARKYYEQLTAAQANISRGP